ncbi:IS30 family transposase [Alkalibacillus flavidus]|uniref:IS30 family transposase n=1 Tax=Alkalibacillus flavidus TaxID=546021 RepID=A0ABV2KTJ0_9BACI
MSYTHLTKTELVFIEEYHAFGLSGRKIAKKLKRGHESVYRIIRKLAEGMTAKEIHLQYQTNKANWGRPKIELPDSETDYIQEKFVLAGRQMSLKAEMKSLFPAVCVPYIVCFNQVYLTKKTSLCKANENPTVTKKSEGNKALDAVLKIETMTTPTTIKNSAN